MRSIDRLSGLKLFAFLLACLSLARAIDLKLITPTAGSAWEVGQDVVVTWEFASMTGRTTNGMNITQIDIDLVKGTPDHLKDNISFGVPTSISSADWHVNGKLEPGDDYMIRITSADNPKFLFLGPKFVIYGGTPTKGQNSAPANTDQDSPFFAYLYFLLIPMALIF